MCRSVGGKSTRAQSTRKGCLGGRTAALPARTCSSTCRWLLPPHSVLLSPQQHWRACEKLNKPGRTHTVSGSACGGGAVVCISEFPGAVVLLDHELASRDTSVGGPRPMLSSHTAFQSGLAAPQSTAPSAHCPSPGSCLSPSLL